MLSLVARDSGVEPQLTLRGRHCCNEGDHLSILVRWIGDRSSSTPTRAAQLGVPTPTTARRLVDQDAPRIQRGLFAPIELPAATRRPQLHRLGQRRRQRRLLHESRRLTTGGGRLRSLRRYLIF